MAVWTASIRRVALGAMCLGMVACSSLKVDYAALQPDGPARDAKSVEVIPAGGNPSRPYDVMGELKVMGDRRQDNADLLEEARKEAGKRGADAIVMLGSGGTSPLDSGRMMRVSLIRYQTTP